MSRSIRLLLATCAATTLVVAVAHAQAVPQEQARVHFNRGLALVDDSRFEEAAVEFAQAYELRPHPFVLYNLALAQAQGRQRAAALASFSSYMALPDHDRNRTKEVRTRLAELEAKVGRISLELEPPMAAVRVDGRLQARADQLLLDPGKHSLFVFAEGYVSSERELIVAEGAKFSLTVRLERSVAADAAEADALTPAARPRVAFLPALGTQPPMLASLARSIQPPTSESRGSTSFWVGASLFGAGVAFGSTSLGLFVDNGNRYEEWQREEGELGRIRAMNMPIESTTAARQTKNDARADRIKLHDEIAVGAAVAGGLLVVAAAAWWVFDLRAPSKTIGVRSKNGIPTLVAELP